MAAAHASSQTHAILNLPLGNASGATNDFSDTARREDAEYRLRDGVLSGRESPAGEETPLLRPRASSASTAPKEASELNASINLINTIIGAGIVSLPYACALTGFASFVALVAMTQMMTKETIGWLCKAADAVGQTTLYATTRVLLGDYAEVALRLTVLVNNYGLLIVYLVVGGDVMAGGAGVEEKGLLAQWFPQTCDVATPHWACTREFFTATLAATLLLPLCSLDNISSLASVSALAVTCTFTFVITCLFLGVYALATDGAPDTSELWPDVKRFDGSPAVGAVRAILASVPALVTAFVCHYNVLLIRSSMGQRDVVEDPSKRDARVFGRSLGFVGMLYIFVASAGVLYFGKNVSSDALDEFVFDKLRAAFKYHWLATVVSNIVRMGYATSLSLTYPLIFFEMRQSVEGLLSLLVGAPFVANRPGELTWPEVIRRRLLTVMLIASHGVLAVVIPNIWVIIHFIGSTGAIAIGFLFPAAIHVAANFENYQRGLPKAATSVWSGRIMFVFGLVVMVFALVEKSS